MSNSKYHYVIMRSFDEEEVEKYMYQADVQDALTGAVFSMKLQATKLYPRNNSIFKAVETVDCYGERYYKPEIMTAGDITEFVEMKRAVVEVAGDAIETPSQELSVTRSIGDELSVLDRWGSL